MKTREIILGLCISASVVFAQNSHNRHNGGYDYVDYGSQQIVTTQYIKVVRREPIYENIIERVPYEECRRVNTPIHNRPRLPHDRVKDHIGTIIGGIAGGAIGHQIGKGRGNTIATIGGAIIGSAIGNDISHQGRHHRNDRVYYEEQRVCDTRYTETSKRVIRGYNNIGYYKRNKIVKYSSRKLRKIPITVTISY